MLGSVVGGRYLLVGLLGQGGMGSVYEARDTSTGHRVAVKLISAQATETTVLAARLQREARAVGLVASRHVARLLDTGADATSQVPYVVMEYLAGETLQACFDRLGPLPPELALRIAAQACTGMESVHAANLVHRDIKPSNLFLEETDGGERLIKLLDFGLAKPQPGVGDPAAWGSLTQSGGLLGSPFYMSPEQARGLRSVDHRSDIWSLGVVLYKALTGSTPHEDLKGLGELIIAICQRPAVPVLQRAPWLPPEIARITDRALELDPNRRFQSATEMREALCALLPGGTAVHASMLVRLDPALAATAPPSPPRPTSPHDDAVSNETTATRVPPPALRPDAPTRIGQLPSPVNRLIGREREETELRQLVDTCRLVTLLGPGGTGKTRLSLHVAARLADSFEHGAGFVDLSPVTDPSAVPQAIAVALGIREEPDQPLRTTLALQLRSKHLLIVLDNCEHLVAACAEYAEHLLSACSRLRLIATSREPLAIPGETTFLLSPLPVPELTSEGLVEAIASSDAVRLFVERAQAVNPSFTLTQATAGPVAHVCRQLDGIPLAIELAAARIRAMTVEQLAAQVDDRFRLLAGVRRGVSRRQQTLRALIDWSHDLLSEAERAVLRRLSVFQGGFTLPAAEAVCAWEGAPLGIQPLEVMDLLYLLVSKSLVIAGEHAGGTRYRMLETIRHYARDKLHAAREEAPARAHHLAFFLQLAEEASPALQSDAQLSWLSRLELEHDNLRAALDAGEATPEHAERALRLAGALGRFWWLRGHHSEGCARIERLLTRGAGVPVAVRARAICQLALLRPGIVHAHPAWEEGLTAYREAGDARGMAFALIGAIEWERQRGNREATLPMIQEGIALARGAEDSWLLARHHDELGRYHLHRRELPEAARAIEAGLALARTTGDRWLVGLLLQSLALTSSFQGDHARAKVLLLECMGLQQALGFKRGKGETLAALGGALQFLGEGAEAIRCFGEALSLARSIGNEELAARAYLNLGEEAVTSGDVARARASLRALFELNPAVSRKENIAWGLLATALLARNTGLPEQAVRLFGAEQTLEETFGIALHPHWRRNYEDALQALLATLGAAGDLAWSEGRKLQPAEAIQTALAYLSSS